MAWITDGLRSCIERVSGLTERFTGGRHIAFTSQLALAAYMSSGMLRKVIAIPAADRVREWRDWQTDKDAIALIETEEKRLQLQAKTKFAETLRGLGGGAMILITNGGHDQPLKPDTIQKGGLIAINVVSRWQITCKSFDQNLASPTYGEPKMFSVQGDGRSIDIHPSRVICFRGDPLPAGTAVSHEDAFWGDSRLLRVYAAVERSDDTQAWFAALVKKAKLLRIGIPHLTDTLSMAGGEDKLAARIATVAQSESVLNATVFDAGDGKDNGGEKITDYQVTWAGIPAIMDAFDQRVAAVSDIPFTRLMGRSPAGMNATGDHDTDNWNRMVVSGQNLETRPCLERIDPILLRSAGAKPDTTWKFAPLWTPTEKEEAETFDKTMDAVGKLQNTGTIPAEAFAEAVQNLMGEREYLPGLDQALAKIPEGERYGGLPDPGGIDPNSDPTKGGGQQSAESGGSGGRPAARATAMDEFFADAAARPLYVQRKLLNATDLIKWAKAQGIEMTLPAEDMHVTVLFSRTAVDPMKMGENWSTDPNGGLTVKPGGPRAVERLGENAVVLMFASSDLVWRHGAMIEAGGSHDYPEYQPHVTLSYGVPLDFDLEAIKPYAGKLEFGPELFEALDLDWKSKVVEA